MRKVLRIIILFIAINLALVAGASDVSDASHIDSEVQSTLDEFIMIAASKGFTFSEDAVDIHLMPEIEQINPQPGEITIAVCYRYPGEQPQIVVDVDQWNNTDPFDREALLFHELGHCFLGRDHREERYLVNGVFLPVSVMNHLPPRFVIYKLFRVFYINELFDLDQIPPEIILTHYRPVDNHLCAYLNSCPDGIIIKNLGVLDVQDTMHLWKE